MDTDTNLNSEQDQQAVQAVRAGDAERYRELVERHERRVFAVAWSRLGDAALAEDAAQEAFVRAYQRLWLLGDGAKFSAWITAIARRVAVNCGLRHRRELERRARWALEQNPASAEEPPELCPPETLRQALAELPAAHRECLVLFYLEGKSGAEAAAALGISENALRARLHRARALLRESLEEKLEGSLARLGPGKTLVPAVMAGVLASSPVKAATAGGVGGAILGALAKFTPFKWLLTFVPLLLPLIVVLPALIVPALGLRFHRWQRRDDQRNYRDAKGFRASLHGQFDESDESCLVCLTFVLGIILVLVSLTTRLLGTKTIFLILGGFSGVTTLFAARQLQINRSRPQIGALLNGLFLCGGCLSVGLGRLPVLTFAPLCVLTSFSTLLANRSRPVRMDYNLFLRATQGLLPPSDLPARTAFPIRFERATHRAFARFLGERQLAGNFRWGPDGLTLYQQRLKSPLTSQWNRIFPSVKNDSNITLQWDGLVTARCGKRDAAALEALRANSVADPGAVENQVALAVSQAWREFREGKTALAERAIGQIPESEIFVVPPARTQAARWFLLVFGGIMAVCMFTFGILWLFPERFSDLKPVNVTEAEVRAFLGGIHTNPNPVINGAQRSDPGDPMIALKFCLVLPPSNLFSPEGWRAARQEVLRNTGLNTQDGAESKLLAMQGAWLLHKAMAGGWLGWNDVGLNPQEAAGYFHKTIKTNQLQFTLAAEQSGSWVDNKEWEVERINDLTLNQLRWLRDVNCLDLVDRAKLIRQIASVQDLSAVAPPGQPTLHDWRDARGLFFTPGWPALRDTYFSLAALEILGGLDQIDREECVRGILRRHHGRGFFDSPSSGSYNEYKINGDQRDTFCAFESLRILGALDRVKDLDKWRFRPAEASEPGAAPRVVTWDEIEAWVCARRLARGLAEHQQTPAAPWRSLLEP